MCFFQSRFFGVLEDLKAVSGGCWFSVSTPLLSIWSLAEIFPSVHRTGGLPAKQGVVCPSSFNEEKGGACVSRKLGKDRSIHSCS